MRIARYDFYMRSYKKFAVKGPQYIAMLEKELYECVMLVDVLICVYIRTI